ncbi:copper resistance protein NlpE N-terminal domain-containing protein [Fodinibius salsisoli]|uniref:Copper resistance protein NlpE N-terminal domain-containing protein n=1 Tax=Fodinibius salsisoli TaxID=2820877 RepID=A0ABT3PNQ3_9BACT|nr:copper resistance protein NlpE N-terminal domain-containing protein [Fodinibius salsisoli]MCW9707479.1 copper resistance protein NlpE N-terminal domain-containing protein [Fodinibius salsisoli]
MQRILILLVFISGAVILGGCSGQSEDTTSTQTIQSLEGATYSGIIPCADCPGILYEISFDETQKYSASSIYIGESNRPFTESGSWSVENDTLIVLKGDSGDQARQFALDDSSLVMLDQEGNRITGSLADHYVLDLKDASDKDDSMKWAELREQGVDFRAAGNEPFWGLAIDYDSEMNFHTLGGDSIQVPVPDMEQDTASAARTLVTETESGVLTVALHPTGCIDNMSGEVFTHGVVVDYDGTSYRGCGNVINDRYSLHDFWTLHALKGKEVSKQDSLRKVPDLQFDLKNNKVYGNNGCNQINGNLVTVTDDSLSFGQMISTKMACPGDMEARFMDALQQVNSYTIEQGQLLLLSDNDTLMTFHRAE